MFQVIWKFWDTSVYITQTWNDNASPHVIEKLQYQFFMQKKQLNVCRNHSVKLKMESSFECMYDLLTVKLINII